MQLRNRAPLPRLEIERIPCVTHGGFHSSLPQENLLDFSANINPFGPSPRIWDAMRQVPISQHPDPRAMPLRHALAACQGVDPAALLVGNGAVDLIYQLAVAYLRPSDQVLVVAPTFGEYAAAATMMGAAVITYPTFPAGGHCVDGGVQCVASLPNPLPNLDALLLQAQQICPRMLFICNPNNPTGTYLDRASIEAVLNACPDTLLVLDEAFVNFVAAPWCACDLLNYGNLLILRSMTKDYALTGLRLGYAIAAPEVIAALEKVQPPWSVNALALAAGMAALEDKEHLSTSLVALAEAKAELVDALVGMGLPPLPSSVHFFLLPVHSASAWQRALLQHNILVRDCMSFGLPAFIRIATQQPAVNARLLEAMLVCKEELCPGMS